MFAANAFSFDVPAWIAIGISMASLAFAFVIFQRQHRLTSAQPVALEAFREIRHSAMTRRRLLVGLGSQDPALGLDGITDPDLQQDALDVSHTYDNVGMLVAHGLVGIDVVAGYMGDSALHMWKALWPYIESERRLRVGRGDATDPVGYQTYFEDLATIRLINRTPIAARRAAMPELYERHGETLEPHPH